jgi:hypothetical protein
MCLKYCHKLCTGKRLWVRNKLQHKMLKEILLFMFLTLITQSYLIMHSVTIRTAVWFIKMQRITRLFSRIYLTESRESVIWSVVYVKPLAVLLHKRLTPYKSLRWLDNQGNCHDRKFNWTNDYRKVTVTIKQLHFSFLASLKLGLSLQVKNVQ